MQNAKTMRPIGSLAALVLLIQTGMAAAQVLPEGTAVHLQTRDEISSKSAKVGDPVNLVVREPVVIGGATLIPAGSAAIGKVTRARENGWLGRPGKLEISVSHVDVGGRPIPLRGEREKKGGSGAPGMVGAAVVFLPLGLFVKGREAKIKAGTPVDVFVAQETPVAVASTEPATAEPPEPSPKPVETLTTIDLPPSAAAPESSPSAPLPPK